MYRIAVIAVFVVGCSKKEEPAKGAPATTPVAPAGWVEADPARPLDATLAEQAKLAIKDGKKPYAYLHADWCEPCVAIEKTRTTDARMKAAFAGTHIIAIDADAVPEPQITGAGMKLAVIPIFYRLDEGGRPTGASIDGGAWGENIPANMAPPLTAFFAK